MHSSRDHDDNTQEEDDSGTTEDEEFLKLTWTCCNKKDNEVGISDTAYNLTSVEDQKFAKVRRQNLIVKQKNQRKYLLWFD